MAVAVVDQLKAVKIEEMDGELTVLERCGAHTVLETLSQEQPIRQSGQRVLSHKVGQIMLCREMLNVRSIQMTH